MTNTFLKLSISLTLLLCSIAHAQPWIDTSDIHLKSNIQLLADKGYILTPVTTYPLMWHDIARDLKKIDGNKLTYIESNAFIYKPTTKASKKK